MDERMRVAILTGCCFVAGLHLGESARLVREVVAGPYSIRVERSAHRVGVRAAAPAEAHAEPYVAALSSAERARR